MCIWTSNIRSFKLDMQKSNCFLSMQKQEKHLTSLHASHPYDLAQVFVDVLSRCSVRITSLSSTGDEWC